MIKTEFVFNKVVVVLKTLERLEPCEIADWFWFEGEKAPAKFAPGIDIAIFLIL